MIPVRFAAMLLLLLGALFALGADGCIDSSIPRCNVLIVNPGCNKLAVRQRCRRSCNVCESYEIPNPKSLTETAVLYGGNHIVTWNRLPFDCTGRGEFTLMKNSRKGLKVAALFQRPDGMRTSVTKAVSLKGTGPRLQIGVNNNQSSAATSVGQCRLIFWFGGMRLSYDQVEQLGGYQGVSSLSRFEPFLYQMDVRGGARVTMSLRYGVAQGCYFDRVTVKIRESLKKDTKGLMGYPEGVLRREWPRAIAGFVNIGTRKSRSLSGAYDYCTREWCVTEKAASNIRYQGLGTFFANRKCSEPYDGFRDFRRATPQMQSVCGRKNFECLHDALSTGIAQEGVITNRLIGEMELATAAVKGFRVEPRAVSSTRYTKVTFSVTIEPEDVVPGLQYFGLFQVDPNHFGSEIFYRNLEDNGDVTRGDMVAGDLVFTVTKRIRLRNGYHLNYYVAPYINGRYEVTRGLTFWLPLGNRGYSPESGVTV